MLDRALSPEAKGVLKWQRTFYVIPSHIDWRNPINNPRRQRASDTPTRQDANGVQASRGPHAVNLGYRTHHRHHVVREAFRTTEERADSGRCKARNAFHRIIEKWRNSFVVRRNRAKGKFIWRAFRVPSLTHRLKESDEQAPTLFPEVAVRSRIFDDGKITIHAINRLGQQVVMLRGLQR